MSVKVGHEINIDRFRPTARHSSSWREPNFEAWYLYTTGRPAPSILGGRTV